MKNYLLVFSFLLFGLFFSLNGYSQTGFSVHAGPSIYLQENGFEKVIAGETGLHVGFHYQYPIIVEKLKLDANIDFLFRNSALTPQINRSHFTGYYQDLSKLSYPKYVPFSTVPLTIGLSYYIPFYEETSFFIGGQVGVSYVFTPQMRISYLNEQKEVKSNMDRNMCYIFNAGFVVDETYFITLNCLYFDANTVNGEAFDFIDISSPTISLTLGYGF